MRKTLVILTGAILLAVTVAVLFFRQVSTDVNQPLVTVIGRAGPPTFLAKSTEVYRDRGRVLRIDVDIRAPSAVADWGSVSNTLAVWTSSEYSRRTAKYFYEDIQKNASFDGTAWITCDSWGGEKVIIAEIDKDGRVSAEKRVAVVGISLRLLGATPKVRSSN